MQLTALSSLIFPDPLSSCVCLRGLVHLSLSVSTSSVPRLSEANTTSGNRCGDGEHTAIYFTYSSVLLWISLINNVLRNWNRGLVLSVEKLSIARLLSGLYTPLPLTYPNKTPAYKGKTHKKKMVYTKVNIPYKELGFFHSFNQSQMFS